MRRSELEVSKFISNSESHDYGSFLFSVNHSSSITTHQRCIKHASTMPTTKNGKGLDTSRAPQVIFLFPFFTMYSFYLFLPL
jgi:hypothetical protein